MMIEDADVEADASKSAVMAQKIYEIIRDSYTVGNLSKEEMLALPGFEPDEEQLNDLEGGAIVDLNFEEVLYSVALVTSFIMGMHPLIKNPQARAAVCKGFGEQINKMISQGDDDYEEITIDKKKMN